MTEIEEITGGMDLTTFLFRCHDFEFFCNNVLKDFFTDGGIKDYMMEWFNLIEKHDRVAILAPSGFGKTTVLGVAYPLWLIFTKRNKQIMILSNSERQAKDVLSRIKSAIETNPLLVELKPKDFRETWAALDIKTTTKCRVFCKPFTKSVKGVRVDYEIMDEAASYNEPSAYFDYIVPRLNPNGKIVLISTAENASDLMAMIEERQLEGYQFRRYPAIINGDIETGESIWPERFPMEKLRSIRKDIGHQFFEKNFLNNLVTEMGTSIFSANSIQLAKDKNSVFTTQAMGGEIFIGCDFAIAGGPTADFDVYVVAEVVGDSVFVKYAEIHKGVPVDFKVTRIEELYHRYQAIQVICDESSIGAEVIKELRFNGVPTESQSFQSQARNKLLNNLKYLFDNGKIRLPANPDDPQTKMFLDKLEIELLSFIEKKLSHISAYVSTGAHDDTVMALAMAVKKTKQYRGNMDYWGMASDLPEASRLTSEKEYWGSEKT